MLQSAHIAGGPLRCGGENNGACAYVNGLKSCLQSGSILQLLESTWLPPRHFTSQACATGADSMLLQGKEF
jgi:hypothetical protein